MVLIGRMIQGIGTGIILPLMFTIAMLIFPPNKLGTVNGVLALVIMFAPAIGPTLTGLILAAGSWRDIFFTFVVFLVIAFVIGLFSLKNVSQITKPKVDFVSIILSIFAFSGLIAGASFASEMGWLSVPVLACLIVGVIALIFYVRCQLKLEVPVLNMRVFRHRNFTWGAILVMVDFGIILSAMYLLPQYLQNGLLVAVALTGIIFAFSGLIAGASFASEMGWLSVPVLACLIVGVIALIFYVRCQLKLEVPVLNMRVFRHRNFTWGAILVMVDFGIILSAMYLLPQYLQNGLLVAVALTGIIMLLGGVINAVTSAFAGRMYDSFGAKWPARIGFIIAFVGAVMLSVVTTYSAIWYVILAHFFLMIGALLAMSP